MPLESEFYVPPLGLLSELIPLLAFYVILKVCKALGIKLSGLLMTLKLRQEFRVWGMAIQMKTFNYAFENMLGELILQHSDNLSSTLQHKSLSQQKVSR